MHLQNPSSYVHAFTYDMGVAPGQGFDTAIVSFKVAMDLHSAALQPCSNATSQHVRPSHQR